jgi:hypothetical protein
MNRREMSPESGGRVARFFSAMLSVTGDLLGRRQNRGQVILLKPSPCLPGGPKQTGAFDGPNIFCRHCKGGKAG